MNPNAIPNYQAFASSLTPDQRSYVQNYVLSAVAELVSPLVAEAMALTKQNKSLTEQIGILQDRVDRYEEKFREDGKYILTRPKLVAFMKEQGIK